MMQKAWSSIEEVPYCILGSSIKFQSHTGWKIDDLNPVWVRLLCQSQLSNPSDLPCYTSVTKQIIIEPRFSKLILSPHYFFVIEPSTIHICLHWNYIFANIFKGKCMHSVFFYSFSIGFVCHHLHCYHLLGKVYSGCTCYAHSVLPIRRLSARLQ